MDHQGRPRREARCHEISQRAVGRHAPTRGDRADADPQAADHPDGRTLRRAGSDDEAAHAGAARGPVEGSAGDRVLRDAFDRRGDLSRRSRLPLLVGPRHDHSPGDRTSARSAAEGHAARAGLRRARQRDSRHHGYPGHFQPGGRLIVAPIPEPLPGKRPPREAGMSDYLKEAFLFRWNLLFFGAGLAAAALTPVAGILLPLVAASELTYLAGLVSIPRFRAAIDSKVYNLTKPLTAAPSAPPPSLVQMVKGLPRDAGQRFQQLQARCLELRSIAAGVRGAAGDPGSSDEIRTPGLDRLLWLFLRLLLSK